MNTPSSSAYACIRTRSPRSAPPVIGDDGSTATTATLRPRSRNSAMSAATSVDFPAPGGPVIPTRCARPARRYRRRRPCSATGVAFSTAVSSRASERRSPAVAASANSAPRSADTEGSAPATSVARPRVRAKEVGDLADRGPGSEDARDTGLAERLDVGVGGDAADGDEDVVETALLEQAADPRYERHVRAREDRQPDDVDVLLQRCGGHHLGCLAQTRVDDLEALVTKAAREHLGAAVVTVEPGLRDQHLEGTVGHGPMVPTGRPATARRSGGRRRALDVREELGARLVAAPEEAEDGRRRHDASRLPDAAHDRAQMGRFDDDADALRGESLHQEIGDLLRQPLLDLQPPGVHLDHARDLREADDAAVRDVRDVGRPEERQEVVLAERIERHVLDDDHLGVLHVEDRAVDEPLRIDVVTGRQLDVHPVNALGRALEAVAIGVLADLGQDLADRRLDPAIGLESVARARPLDVAALADLRLDLVDEAADVRGERGGGPFGHPGRWYVPSLGAGCDRLTRWRAIASDPG